MQAAYSMGPQGDLNARKQALIKKLSGQRQGSGGGAARLSAGTPFGALPRLGFNSNARSVFGRNEQFNFAGGPPGFQQAADGIFTGGAFAPPQQGGGIGNAPIGGVGPAAGAGSGSPGLPQGVPQGGGSSMGAGQDMSTWHLLNGGQPPNAQGATGAIPQNVQQAMQGDAPMSGGVAAWLAANPWFYDQLQAGGGGGVGGGGTVL